MYEVYTWWLIRIIQILWEAIVGESLEAKSSRLACQHSKTSSLPKYKMNKKRHT